MNHEHEWRLNDENVCRECDAILSDSDLNALWALRRAADDLAYYRPDESQYGYLVGTPAYDSIVAFWKTYDGLASA